MKTERIYQIQEYISRRGVVTIKELMEQFRVSLNTIRRDLNELERLGKIEKIYGGAKCTEATLSASNALISYTEREVRNSLEKDAIARQAAAMIQEDDTIFIDTGTSTVPLLRHLRSFEHLTIVTNSVYVLYSALELPQFTVIGLPGIEKRKTASLVGDQCVQMLERYRFSKAFMACTTFSLSDGASNSSVEEFDIKRMVMSRSAEKYLLVDASKFGKASLLTFAGPDEFDYVITDTLPDPEYIRFFEEHNIRLITSM